MFRNQRRIERGGEKAASAARGAADVSVILRYDDRAKGSDVKWDCSISRFAFNSDVVISGFQPVGKQAAGRVSEKFLEQYSFAAGFCIYVEDDIIQRITVGSDQREEVVRNQIVFFNKDVTQRQEKR